MKCWESQIETQDMLSRSLARNPVESLVTYQNQNTMGTLWFGHMYVCDWRKALHLTDIWLWGKARRQLGKPPLIFFKTYGYETPVLFAIVCWLFYMYGWTISTHTTFFHFVDKSVRKTLNAEIIVPLDVQWVWHVGWMHVVNSSGLIIRFSQIKPAKIYSASVWVLSLISSQ